MSSMFVLLAPLSIFMLVVAPLWLVLHYRSQRRLGEGISEDDRVNLQDLSERANTLQERVEALEAILDDSVPGWRKQE